MSTAKDISNIEDIRLLVDSFYTSVRQNPLLGPVFDGVIQDQWPVHLEKMYRFWQTLLLEEHTYYGAPFPPHARLPIGAAHFNNWLTIWKETVDKHFNGPIADEAKWRADKMATIFQIKLDQIQERTGGAML